MGGGNFFGTDLDTIKDCLATPDASLTVYVLENLLLPTVPWVDEKTVCLGQHGWP